MNVEWLQSFVEAAKQQSLSKAAKVLTLSQPALSKHIRNLEQDLGITLFHRTTSGIKLTDAGNRFHQRIVPVVAELLSIRQEARQWEQSTAITIGSLPSLATYYLPSKIKSLQQYGRPISFMIQNTSAELMQSLREGRLDAAFVDQSHVEESMWSCELFSESYYAVIPLHHRLSTTSTVKLHDLKDDTLIVHQGPCDTRNHVFEQFERLGHKQCHINEMASGDFIFGAVAAGMGITIVPELTAGHLAHLQLAVLPIADLDSRRTISLAAQHAQLGSKLYKWISSI